MSLHIYRAVVRGQFADLTDERRAALVADAEAHDIFQSSYTADGTFTYDERIQAFSFRFEIRERTSDDVGPDELEGRVLARAEALATAYLTANGIGYKRLRASATDMAEMWR